MSDRCLRPALLKREVNDVTLNNPGHLVIFAEIDQLLLSGQGGRPVGRVSFSAECDIRQVQA
jgi:hypothetical protein